MTALPSEVSEQISGRPGRGKFRPEGNEQQYAETSRSGRLLGRMLPSSSGPTNAHPRRSAIINGVVGNKLLPASIRQDIIERTDGIPLFVSYSAAQIMVAVLLQCGDTLTRENLTNHETVADARQVGREVLGDAVGEIVLTGIA